jgi:hypothetical protein
MSLPQGALPPHRVRRAGSGDQAIGGRSGACSGGPAAKHGGFTDGAVLGTKWAVAACADAVMEDCSTTQSAGSQAGSEQQPSSQGVAGSAGVAAGVSWQSDISEELASPLWKPAHAAGGQGPTTSEIASNKRQEHWKNTRIIARLEAFRSPEFR